MGRAVQAEERCKKVRRETDVRFSEDQLTLPISVKRSSKIGARKMVTRLSNMKTGLISAGATQGRGWRVKTD